MGRYDGCIVHCPCTIEAVLERLPGTTIEDINGYIQEGELRLFSKLSGTVFMQCQRRLNRDIWGRLDINEEYYVFEAEEVDALFALLYYIGDIPYRNNSMWIGVNALSNRWQVDTSDILARMRTGELYSNRYNNFSSDKANPSILYPLGSEHEISCHFGDHIWPYENKHPALKKAAINQYNIYAGFDGLPEINVEELEKNDHLPFAASYSNVSKSGDQNNEVQRKIADPEVLQSVQESTNRKGAPKTANAIIGNLKKRVQELTNGYEDAAKLAHAITVDGPQRGGNPWSEAEILNLEKKLGVSIKGDCLKAFKAGMPAELVKKDAGARPITPREESPDDVES